MHMVTVLSTRLKHLKIAKAKWSQGADKVRLERKWARKNCHFADEILNLDCLIFLIIIFFFFNQSAESNRVLGWAAKSCCPCWCRGRFREIFLPSNWLSFIQILTWPVHFQNVMLEKPSMWTLDLSAVMLPSFKELVQSSFEKYAWLPFSILFLVFGFLQFLSLTHSLTHLRH